MDLTSVSYAIEDNKALIYALEQFLSIMPNIRVIAQTAQIDVLLKYFPLFLDGQEPVCKLLPDLSGLGEKEPEESELAKVTDLSGESFETFIDAFDHNLIGHRYFKDRLRYSLKNFISLNKAKEQKVLSIFLFGASGIGKTEVARLIANGLQNDCYLAKINFQNYSSQDALNSLIGSPAGYVGCNHGELSEKFKRVKSAYCFAMSLKRPLAQFSHSFWSCWKKDVLQTPWQENMTWMDMLLSSLPIFSAKQNIKRLFLPNFRHVLI